MPELPEVEGARRLVKRNCVGKRSTKAIIGDDDKVIAGIAPRELERALEGRSLVAAKRRGKQMWWDFDAGPSLLLHFGMTGGLVIKGVGAAHYKSFAIDDSSWPPRFCKLELHFEDGTQLAFCDSRRFAKVRFLEQPEQQPPISELGWDPLLDMPPLEDFAAQLARQRRAIKALLLDQSFSAGVGNWVADEVLYQAAIHPEQPAHSIPAEQVAALHHAIRHVCQLACEVEADADKFPPTWLFHHRWGKGSGTKSKVGGHTIEHITVGGRTSAVVPAVQKLNKTAIAAQAAAAAAAAAAGGSGGKKAAAGGGKKKKQAAAVGEDKEVATAAAGAAAAGSVDVVATAAAEAAVAVAQGSAKPCGSRGKAAAAREAAAAAAEVAQQVKQEGEGGAGAGAATQQQAGRASKQFRGRRGAAAAGAATAAAAAAATDGGPEGSAAGKPAAAAPAAGRKRKAPAVGASSAATAGGDSKGALSRQRAAAQS